MLMCHLWRPLKFYSGFTCCDLNKRQVPAEDPPLALGHLLKLLLLLSVKVNFLNFILSCEVSVYVRISWRSLPRQVFLTHSTLNSLHLANIEHVWDKKRLCVCGLVGGWGAVHPLNHPHDLIVTVRKACVIHLQRQMRVHTDEPSFLGLCVEYGHRASAMKGGTWVNNYYR